MRCLVNVNIPVEAGNGAAKAGKLGATIHAILEDLDLSRAGKTADSGRAIRSRGQLYWGLQQLKQRP
jgi:hypothetical protein